MEPPRVARSVPFRAIDRLDISLHSLCRVYLPKNPVCPLRVELRFPSEVVFWLLLLRFFSPITRVVLFFFITFSPLLTLSSCVRESNCLLLLAHSAARTPRTHANRKVGHILAHTQTQLHLNILYYPPFFVHPALPLLAPLWCVVGPGWIWSGS